MNIIEYVLLLFQENFMDSEWSQFPLECPSNRQAPNDSQFAVAPVPRSIFEQDVFITNLTFRGPNYMPALA